MLNYAPISVNSLGTLFTVNYANNLTQSMLGTWSYFVIGWRQKHHEHWLSLAWNRKQTKILNYSLNHRFNLSYTKRKSQKSQRHNEQKQDNRDQANITWTVSMTFWPSHAHTWLKQHRRCVRPFASQTVAPPINLLGLFFVQAAERKRNFEAVAVYMDVMFLVKLYDILRWNSL